MVLSMSRPFAHPKTGVYWLRKVVPADLRKIVGKRELKETLQTKDPRQARAKAPTVLARFDAIIAVARKRIIATAENGGSQASEREIAALCGEWYREECELWGDNPGDPDTWDVYLDLVGERWEDVEEGEDSRLARVFLKPEDRAEATSLLQAHGYVADPATVDLLAEALLPTKAAFAREMIRRAGGDWSPDKTPSRFPAMAPRNAPEEAPQVLKMGALVAAWAAESGTAGKALYDRERTAANLAAFLGHDDAARVTADDVVRWKEARLGSGRSTKTVANDIGELRPIWTWASETGS
jgi:hypothetical protein